MILCFTLSMPSNNSWDGRWSGKANLYARTVNFGRSPQANDRAREILDKGYYSYNFRDGWRAGITVTEVDAKQAKNVARKTKGFCGYDWMIESIRKHNEIKVEEK